MDAALRPSQIGALMARPRERETRPHEAKPIPGSASEIPPQVERFLKGPAAPKGFVNRKPLKVPGLRERVHEADLRLTVPPEELLKAVNRIKPARTPFEKFPEDIQGSILTLRERLRRFHGIKIPLYWFPLPWIISTCADRFGYMSSTAVRNSTKLPFNVPTQALLGQLGDM